MSEQLIQTPGVFGETGNFLLERELGKGGMGGVYLGRDKMLDRPVAVKVMLKQYGSDPAFVEKFKTEAQAAARLIHPNIAQIYSYGISDGMPYIAMELVAGGSLDQLMKTAPGKTDIPRVMKIGEQVAQALRCAADQGLVHGDVKPENVLLDANGNAKLVDFGLAAMQKNTEEIWGTPYYIAPEKVKKEVVDYRADMYSLGGTIYHALTGVAPFEGPDTATVVRARFLAPPKKPSEVRPGISPQIDALVLKMLALNKEDRFPSFEALLEEFKKVLALGLEVKPAEPAPAAAEGASEAKAAAHAAAGHAAGGHKLVLKKGGLKHKLKVAAEGGGEDEAGDDGEGEDEDRPKRGYKVKGKKRRFQPEEPPEDDEESGGVGGKVVLTVLGTILLIGGVIGGLVWYQVADRKAREEEHRRQVADGVVKAKEAITKTREVASNFIGEFTGFAKQATDACQKSSDDIADIFKDRPEVGAALRPAPTAELLAAIASTNVVDAAGTNGLVAASSTNGVAAAVSSTNAVAAAGAGRKRGARKFRPPFGDECDPASPEYDRYQKEKAAYEAKQQPADGAAAAAPEEAVKRFRPPTEDEADPASPEHEAYEKAKAEFEAKQQSGGSEAKAETPTNAVAAVVEAPKPMPAVVKDVNDLWERAYACQAATIRVVHQLRTLVRDIDETLAKDDGTADAETLLTAFSGKSHEFTERMDALRGAKDVETVRKGITFIKSKGTKTVKQTIERLRIEKLEAQRKAAKEAEEKAEKERLEREAVEKAERIKRECKDADDLLAAMVQNGMIRQLDWEGCHRKFNALKDHTTSAEAQVYCDQLLRKVDAMKDMQAILIANLKDYTFEKSKLKGCRVTDVSEKEFRVLKRNSTMGVKISWRDFYQKFHGNLNELINRFVVLGRRNAKPRLTLKPWSEAMMGAALTMRIICADDVAAPKRGEMLAKEAVRQFANFKKDAKVFFPDIDFENLDAETDAPAAGNDAAAEGGK